MLQQLAKTLDQAALNAQSVPQLSLETELDLNQAYKVQELSIEERLSRGEKLVGYKLGFTSRAKMLQMGVDDLIWGRLTNTMIVENNASIDLSQYVHPRAEPEIAFKLKKTLSGKITVKEALDAIDGVAAAIEIIDSRYKNFKFSLTDVIADNCSSAGFVIGDWHKPNIDLSNLRMALQANGKDIAVGSSADILDHPINSLVEAARCIALSGEALQPGQIILAGAATAAVALEQDQLISINIEHLSSCNFNTHSS